MHIVPHRLPYMMNKQKFVQTKHFWYKESYHIFQIHGRQYLVECVQTLEEEQRCSYGGRHKIQ